jgi:hypothetical protein
MAKKHFYFLSWSELNRFSPLLLTAIVSGIYGALYNALTLCQRPSGLCRAFNTLKYQIPQLVSVVAFKIEAMRTQAFAGRITWSMSVGLTIMMSLIGVSVIFYVYYRSWRYYSGSRLRWIVIYIIAPLVLGIGIYYLLAGFGKGGDPWRSFMHKHLLEDVQIVESLTEKLDAFSSILALYISAGAVSILAPFKDGALKWKSDLRTHSKNLKIILYISAALLIVNTLRSATLLNWSMDYIDHASLPVESMWYFVYSGMNTLVMVMVTTRGVLYSFILAALYLPAAAILRQEAEKKAFEDKMTGELRKSWLANFGVFRDLNQVIAILSPVLGGVLTNFILKAI